MKILSSANKIISIICTAAMLAGCAKMIQPENIPEETSAVTASSTTSEKTEETAEYEEAGIYIPKDKFGEAIADEFFEGFIPEGTEIKVMSDENSEKLEEAFKNIRINNSRFALPMMVMALPEGFSVKIDYDSKSEEAVTEDSFYMYSGDLYMGDELCTPIAVILKDGEEEQYGIILGMTALISTDCKWSFGDIEYTNDTEKITGCFGEPSVHANFSDINFMGYVSKTGSIVFFINDTNALLCLSLNTDDTIKNIFFNECVPYDDFDGIPEIPEVTGEPREIDWSAVFNDDCIIIGNDKYSALTPISELGKDIFLFDFNIGSEYEKNDEYLTDAYLLMYKGREIGLANALRKADEPQENGVIFSWVFMKDSLPEYVPAGMMGIPFSQDNASIEKIYAPYKKTEGKTTDFLLYRGTAEKDGENYMCSLMLSSSMFLTVTPASADPEGYENFLANT